MDKHTLGVGTHLAEQAIMFCVTHVHDTTGVQAQRAIRDLFGEEVATEMASILRHSTGD